MKPEAHKFMLLAGWDGDTFDMGMICIPVLLRRKVQSMPLVRKCKHKTIPLTTDSDGYVNRSGRLVVCHAWLAVLKLPECCHSIVDLVDDTGYAMATGICLNCPGGQPTTQAVETCPCLILILVS